MCQTPAKSKNSRLALYSLAVMSVGFILLGMPAANAARMRDEQQLRQDQTGALPDGSTAAPLPYGGTPATINSTPVPPTGTIADPACRAKYEELVEAQASLDHIGGTAAQAALRARQQLAHFKCPDLTPSTTPQTPAVAPDSSTPGKNRSVSNGGGGYAGGGGGGGHATPGNGNFATPAISPASGQDKLDCSEAARKARRASLWEGTTSSTDLTAHGIVTRDLATERKCLEMKQKGLKS